MSQDLALEIKKVLYKVLNRRNRYVEITLVAASKSHRRVFSQSTLPPFLLRCWGMKIGKDVAMFMGAHIRCPSKISIESGVSIGPRVCLDGRSGLIIRKNATLAYECVIWTLHHNFNSPTFASVGEPVEIQEYAWVCCRAIILPGVTVGRGAVVAAGAVVSKNVQPWTVVGGVPARVIGERKQQDVNYIPGRSGLHLV